MENKEYIERGALKRLMTFEESDIITKDGKTFVNFEVVRDYIEYAEACDVKPVKHATWRENKVYYADENGESRTGSVFACTRCGRTEKTKQPYCNCGAKMVDE